MLADGTAWAIWIPGNWNGILISDLDFVSQAGRTFEPQYPAYYHSLVAMGYAACGTARHPLRMRRYDPAREVEGLLAVLDEFRVEVRKYAVDDTVRPFRGRRRHHRAR